jgi:hypothetical protein
MIASCSYSITLRTEGNVQVFQVSEVTTRGSMVERPTCNLFLHAFYNQVSTMFGDDMTIASVAVSKESILFSRAE